MARTVSGVAVVVVVVTGRLEEEEELHTRRKDEAFTA